MLLHKYSTQLLSSSPSSLSLSLFLALKSGVWFVVREKMAVGVVVCFASLISLFSLVQAKIPGAYSGGAWQSAHATFYGGSDASGTMGTSLFSTLCFYLD